MDDSVENSPSFHARNRETYPMRHTVRLSQIPPTFYYVVGMLSCWLWISLCETSKSSDDSISTYHVYGKVVDSSGKPLSDVKVTSADQYDPSYIPTRCETRSDGVFAISHTPDQYRALKVFFYKPGYKCDFFEAYTPAYKPFSVELSPDEPITVQVQDVDGKPVSGASVAPYEVDFDNAFAIEPIGAETAKHLGLTVVTNNEGIATLRGVPFSGLWSLTVSVEGNAPVTYSLPRSVDKTTIENEPIVLKWRGGKNTISVSITESDGTPANDVYVIALEATQAFNRLADKQPTETTHIMRKVDSHGTVSFDLATTAVELRAYSNTRGINHVIGTRQLKANEPQHVSFQLGPACSLAVSILDLSNEAKLEGIEVSLTSKQNAANAIASAITNEDGIAEFTVEPGDWSSPYIARGVPAGYVIDRANFKVAVKSPNEIATAPPLVMRKGRIIRGKIEGVDCAALRFDFIAAVFNKGMDEEDAMGILDENGNFEITLPPEITDAQITCMQISDSPVTNRRSLAILSKEPWLLDYQPNIKVGIGLTIKEDGNKILVASVEPNSPASLVEGLTIGTELVSVANEIDPKTELRGLTLEQVESKLRGPVGSQMILGFIAPGQTANEIKLANLRRAFCDAERTK